MITTPRPQRVDVALAGALAVFGVLGTVATDQGSTVDRPVDALAFALLLVATFGLSVRRLWPLVTLAVAAVATSAFLVLGYPYGPIMLSFFVAVYTVAAHCPLRPAVLSSAAALVILLPHLVTHDSSVPGLLGLVPATAWVVVPFAVGFTVRVSREAKAQAQAETIRDRVYEERLRIAQEVHDVVGHGLAAIKMQADVALHVLSKKPEQAEEALTAISRTSTEALDEVRATLAVVRADEAVRAPAPGLHQLNDLRQRMTESGVEVDLEITGTPRNLPAAAELAGYRVVQESLTNVLKHSAQKRVTLRVTYDAETVTLTISNPAHTVPSGRCGLGIAGMRDRVTSLGGEFSAGPTSDGRFEVHAVIPVGSTP